MIQPVSSVISNPAADAAQPKAAPVQKSNSPQDTVHVSQAALAAAGDADHDGDSH